MPWLSTKSFTVFCLFGPSSSFDMPTMTRPSAAYFFWSSMYPGISALHGAHQVAQKSSTTTLPLNCAEVTVAPSRPFSFHAGAGTGLGGSARRGAAENRAMRSAAEAPSSADFMAGISGSGFARTVARGAPVRKRLRAGVWEVEPECLDELLHGRREDAALPVEDRKRAREPLPLEPEHGERALRRFLDHRRLRHDRYPVVDLD